MDVEHLLLMLKHLALAFSVTNFKLSLKTDSLLALVTAKCCSDLPLLHSDNQYLFHQHHAALVSLPCILFEGLIMHTVPSTKMLDIS